MSTALQPTSIEAVIETRLKDLPFPKSSTAIDTEGKTYQQVHEEQIAEIERRAKKIDPVIDEITRANAQKALTALTKVRTGINRFRLDLFGPITDLKKKFDSYLGTTMDGGLQARIRAIEIPLEESMAKYDRELERIRQEELRKIEDRNKARAAYVVGAGMTFTGAEYKMDELVLWPTDLNTWNEDAFENWKVAKLQPALQARADREKAAREAAEKAAAEAKAAADKLAADMAKQKADEERLAADRAQLEKEKAELRKDKGNRRATDLVDVGASWRECGDVYMDEFCTTQERLADMTEDEWQQVKTFVRDAKEKSDERVRRGDLMDERSRILLDLVHHKYDGEQVWRCGEAVVSDHELSTMSDEEWAIVLAKFHNEEERLSNVPAATDGSDLTLDELKREVGIPELPLGVATELNPDFAPQMEAVHVAPLVEQEREIDHEGAVLIFEAMQYSTKQDCAAFILPAGEKFVVYGTADQIRELLKGR